EFSCAFIIPYYANEYEQQEQGRKKKLLIAETIEGLFLQTDEDWSAIIVVDMPPNEETNDYLIQLKNKFYPKIDIIFLERNVGPGVSRNLGVLKALERGHNIILFNDSDDISHPKRLEVVKKTFLENPQVDVVYSTFEVIDENSRLTPIEKISSPILEILESHVQNPLEGNNIWIKMGTETGITNITSSTAVRIQFAYQCPFPNEKASEDFHSWIRMSAFGANFKYTSLIPTKYRLPSFMKYQASRTRIGPSNFNQIKARVDSDGFSKASEIALARNIIKPEEIPMIKAKFYKRLAKSMRREMENELANELLNKAAQLEYESFVYFNK
ncbi:MAG TPA: glycosyltransferase family 2 protein, partial [Nitrososphaeraceae archaeon]|nr:glycosyltransferase family 2 protein [Nitrososphaeraceae archaeon]